MYEWKLDLIDGKWNVTGWPTTCNLSGCWVVDMLTAKDAIESRPIMRERNEKLSMELANLREQVSKYEARNAANAAELREENKKLKYKITEQRTLLQWCLDKCVGMNEYWNGEDESIVDACENYQFEANNMTHKITAALEASDAKTR